MEESISSSRTSAFYGNSYYWNYRHQLPPAPAPAPAAVEAASDFEDAGDSGWTAYFLQLASDEEEEDASASSREKQLRLRAVPCGSGSASGRGRGTSASMVSKPNKAKDNKQTAVKAKVLKKTRIVEEEEDPLQDTASSPLVQLNINGHLQEVWSPRSCSRCDSDEHHE